MDLEAYLQIGDLEKILKDNNIVIPRLRGLRLMKNEEPVSEEDIKDIIKDKAGFLCGQIIEIDFGISYISKEKNYFYRNKNYEFIDIKWKNVHGKMRKELRFAFKKANRIVRKDIETFNKYCGCDDVLCIHARIGGPNWNYFGGPELSKEPWFIEKTNDWYDCTYCNIYAKIKDCF